MTDLTGSKLERYHLLERLGTGGMATVYRAYDLRLECEMAVKVIRRDAFAPEVLARILQRFEREARVLAKLNHPNIVSVVDYGEYEGAPYLVMRYMPGGTLRDSLGRQMGFGEACRLLLPVARALAYAHREGILHRDVKPSNILLTATGEPVLSDFGIARIVESGESHTLTGTGVGIGTPEYMAPEQGLGLPVDARADVYSLGIVLYELVTGRKPFTADTPIQLIFKQVNEPLPSPRLFNQQLSNEAVQIIEKALAKKPEDRFQSMVEFITALDQNPLAAYSDEAGRPAQVISPGQRPEQMGQPAQKLKPRPEGAAPGAAHPMDVGLTRDEGLPANRKPVTGPVKIPNHPSTSQGMKIPGWAWAAAGLGMVAVIIVVVALVLRTLDKVRSPEAEPGAVAAAVTPTSTTAQDSTPAPELTSTNSPTQTPSGPTAIPTLSPAINTTNIQNLGPVIDTGEFRAEKAVFSPDGKLIAAATARGVHLLDGESLAKVGWIETGLKVSDLAFTPDGKLLATSTGDHTIKLWDVKTSQAVQTLKGIDGMASGIAISPDGVWLAAGDSMGGPKLWSLKDGLLAATIEGIDGFALTTSFSKDSRSFAFGTLGYGGYAGQVSDVTIKWRYSSEDGNNQFSSSVLSPTDGRLAFGSDSGKIYLLRASDGNLFKILEGHERNISGLDYSDEGRWLASSSLDGTVRIWRVTDYSLARTLEFPIRVKGVDFSGDTRRLLICTDDGSISLWEIK